MSENTPENPDQPDPSADPGEGTTEENPDGNDQENSDDEVTTGGELDHSEAPAPIDAAPVTVEPSAVPVSPQAASASNMKTDKVFGKDYEVTPEAGYRKS